MSMLDHGQYSASIGLDASEVSDVPFGRSQFLRGVAGAVVGYSVAKIMRADPAAAQHVAPTLPCYGYQVCHYCSGQICYQYCDAYDPATWYRCDSGWRCWDAPYGGNYYRCCDFLEKFPGGNSHYCLCRARWDEIG